MTEDRVFIVRSTPDLSRFVRRDPLPALRNGRRHVIGYVGVMGSQDGVDNHIYTMANLVYEKGRDDIQCVLVGRGSQVPKLKSLARSLNLDRHVTFTGDLSPEDFLSAISTFDIGVVPDPKSPSNDECSMNKVFEYMSHGIPLVGFNLTETIRSAGDATIYATNNDPKDLARLVAELCDDPDRRARVGQKVQVRAKSVLDWRSKAIALRAAYDKVFKITNDGSTRPPPPEPLTAG
jgi:glycosyltransferase involved in cell wall biosynthesis